MRYILYITIFILLSGCSEKAAESQPEAGHTALGTSAPPAINPVRTDSLQYLVQYIGKYPDAVSLWETEPLRSKLEDLLGTDLELFLDRMQHAAPLQQDLVLYTMSKSTHPDSIAFILIDLETNRLHVSMAEDSIRKQYQYPGESIHLPYKIEQHL